MENENLDVFDRAMLFLGQKTFGYKGIEAEFAVIHEGKPPARRKMQRFQSEGRDICEHGGL